MKNVKIFLKKYQIILIGAAVVSSSFFVFSILGNIIDPKSYPFGINTFISTIEVGVFIFVICISVARFMNSKKSK